MAEGTKSTILIALISAISAIVVAVITTYGTIAVSQPEAKRVKQELEEISDLQLIANLPVGTIVPSMLRPSLFSEVVGDPSVFDPKKSKWVLADGEKDITTSRFGKLHNNRGFTPDLRNMFLRGMNKESLDGKEDPEDREAGDYQADALQDHGHNTDALKLGPWIDEDTPQLGYTSRGGADAVTAGVMNVAGPGVRVADETRPKNVAVYFYIKIN